MASHAASIQSGSAQRAAAAWLEEHGDYLFRYALRHVHDTAAAEDLVQETLLAAMLAHESFEGRSTVRTWLTGILRRKVADCLRLKGRDAAHASSVQLDDDGLAKWVDGQFTRHGRWNIKLGKWPADQLSELESEELGRVLAECVEKLPARAAEVFLLAERHEKSGADLSKILHLSTTNIGVMLYRARMALRRCLEVNWFGSARKEEGA